MRIIALSSLIFLGISCAPQNSSSLLKEVNSGESGKLKKIEGLIQEFENDEQVSTIRTSELMEQLANNPQDYVLVDVRGSDETAVSMIENAITQSQLEADLKLSSSKYRSKKIIAYCTIGYRSMFYTAKLEDQGLNAYNLRGSLLSWLHAGGKVVSPKTGKETFDVHVYGEKWKLAPSAYTMHVKQTWLSSMIGI